MKHTFFAMLLSGMVLLSAALPAYPADFTDSAVSEITGEDAETGEDMDILSFSSGLDQTEAALPEGGDTEEKTDISHCSIEIPEPVFFTGEPQEPEVRVVLGDVLLNPDTDYVVTYADNDAPGEAAVTVTGSGLYTGTATQTFQISLLEPELISAESAGYNAVRVTWEPVPGAENYRLYYRGGGTRKWTPVQESIEDTTFIHTSSSACPLITGTKYAYTVQAVCGDAVSDLAQSILRTKPLPAKPEHFSVKPAGYDRIQLSWDPVPGADVYRVTRLEGGTWRYITQTAGTSFVHANSTKHPVKTGVTYTYRVRAIRRSEKGIFYGAFSEETAVKTTPERAELISVSSGDVFGKITITWKPVEGADACFVYRKAAGDKNWQRIAQVSGTSSSYVHEDSKDYPIVPDTIYSYTVRFYAKSGKTYGSYDTKGMTVTIPPAAEVTDEQLRKKAKEVLESITTPSMTTREKLEACFKYVSGGSWNRDLFPDRTRKGWKYQCAMDELTTRQHNCYGFSHAFAALAREVGCTPYIIEIPLYHCFVQIDGLYWDNIGNRMGTTTASKPYTDDMKSLF